MDVEVEGDRPIGGVLCEEGGDDEVGLGQGVEGLHLGLLLTRQLTVLDGKGLRCTYNMNSLNLPFRQS